MMKFNCESGQLLKSINIVEKSIPIKSTLPVLENMVLEVQDKELILKGYNHEIHISYIMPIANEGENGAILMKAKTLSNIISKLPNQTLNLDINDLNNINIQMDSIGFNILGVASSEYPTLPEIEKGNQLHLKVKDMKELIQSTIIAVCQDDTKKFLQGILVKKENETMTFISTDGYRLAIKKMQVGPTESDFSIIVPFKAFNELNRILCVMNDDKDITMTVSENQVVFEVENFRMISRVLQGQFPDYNQVLPKTCQNQFVLSRRSLIDAVERAGIIASESNNVIRVKFESDRLQLKSQAPKLGEFKEDISLSKLKMGDESDIKVALNYKLILDVLKIMTFDDVLVEFNDGYTPCVIKAQGSDDFIYIIMPIRTSDYNEVESGDADSEA